MQKILFVCTANTCRSPLAEYLLRQLAAEARLAVDVRSAGIYATPGAEISKYSGYILNEREIHHEFGSTRTNEGLLEWADLVLTMTQSHKLELIGRFPHAREKIFTLKEFVLIDEQVEALLHEMNSIYADIELQFSLGQSITDEQRTRLRELEKQLPDLDIADPFAGSIDMYRQCAHEIEHHLRLLVTKLQT